MGIGGSKEKEPASILPTTMPTQPQPQPLTSVGVSQGGVVAAEPRVAERGRVVPPDATAKPLRRVSRII